MRDPKAYAKKVESYVDRFATPEDADQAGDDDDDDEDEDEPMGGSLGRPKIVEKATNGNGLGGNGTSHSHADRNGQSRPEEDEYEEDEADDGEDADDKMSDMGALSDGDEFMGEMDD